jgi:hypothetical protein
MYHDTDFESFSQTGEFQTGHFLIFFYSPTCLYSSLYSKCTMTLALRVSRRRLTTTLHWTKPLHQYHDTDFESFSQTPNHYTTLN